MKRGIQAVSTLQPQHVASLINTAQWLVFTEEIKMLRRMKPIYILD